MAILQALKVSSTTEAMAGVGPGQSAKYAASQIVTTVAPSLNDVIQGSLIQAGSVILDVIVIQSGMGASGAFSVGYGGNTAYWSAAAAGVTGGVRRADSAVAQPLVLTTNDTMDITITAAGATAAVTFTIITIFLPRNA
jgi:uncharacterized membrane protein YeiH